MELLIGLAIIGILATLAVYGVRRYILVSKTAEPIEMINSIRAAQEAYRDETFSYLSTTTTINAYHPGTPFAGKRAWFTGGAQDALWTQLGVQASGPVQFGYACVAGAANTPLPALGLLDGNVNYPTTPATPFFVVKAAGDRDEDSTLAILIGSSFTDEIYSEREDE